MKKIMKNFILTKEELKKLLPAPFYDLYFNRQSKEHDNWNYIVGGKGIGKSWFWCLMCIYNLTNFNDYNAIVSRRLYDYIKNSKDQFRATLTFLDGAETNNGSHITKTFGIEPKKLSLKFEVPRSGNEIHYDDGRKIKFLAYDRPNAWSSLQATKGAFKEIFNDECIRYDNREAKITISSLHYNKYISDVFRAKRKGIANWFIYNPTFSNWIDEIAIKYDPFDDEKLEYIKKHGFSFVNEIVKSRNYNILRCSYLISKFETTELIEDLEGKRQDNEDYFLFEAYGKPLTKFIDGVDAFNVSFIRQWKKNSISTYQQCEAIHIGFDWGKVDRCVMTFVGLYHFNEELNSFERIVVLQELTIEYPEKFKNTLDVMDYLWKNGVCKFLQKNFSWINKLFPLKFYYQSNDYQIVDYLKKQLINSDATGLFSFQVPIAKNEKGWLKQDKYRFAEFLINSEKLYYVNYPETLMKNLRDYQKNELGEVVILRDEDGFDAFIDTFIDIRHLI